MTTRTKVKKAASAPVSGVRNLQLTITRENENTLSLTLSERLGNNGPELEFAKATHKQVARIMEYVVTCVRKSGHSASKLAKVGTSTLDVTEVEGVRLALIILATAPYTSSMQVWRVAEGVAAMSDEEAYYWFSKTVTDRSRATRALRVLFAE